MNRIKIHDVDVSSQLEVMRDSLHTWEGVFRASFDAGIAALDHLEELGEAKESWHRFWPILFDSIVEGLEEELNGPDDDDNMSSRG